MNLMSREEAATIGSYVYFTGRPCKHGHIARRYTKTCVCTECHKAANAKTFTRMNLALMGVRMIKLSTHPDDHAALRAYADLLNLQRGLNVTQPGVAAAPTPAVAQSDEQSLEMWTRTHGAVVAAQMLDSKNQLAAQTQR